MRSLLFSSYSRQPTPSSSSYSSPSSSYLASEQPSSAIRVPRKVHASTPISQGKGKNPKYAPDDFDDDFSVTVSVRSVRSNSSSSSITSASSAELDVAMSIRSKAKREASVSLSPSSPPSTTTGLCRPTTPTSPVQIPKRSQRDASHRSKRDTAHRRRHPKHAHNADSVSPSVAALLAITDIPRQRRKRGKADKSLTVGELVHDQQVSEKELSLSLGRGPMDLLLSPPEDVVDDDCSVCDSTIGSMLDRTTSADSVPSLGGESFATDMISSLDTPGSPHASTRRRLSPMRKSLEPIRSPPDVADEHPLAAADNLGLDELDFTTLEASKEAEDETTSSPLLQPFKPLRSAFKSNLTASLRALRSAAKSFSSINFPTIPPDDFLTRSILTIDPNVPYADERRPPVTEEMPSAELRRYLNPTTSAHLDPQPTSRLPGTFAASIQMQTYKVQRSRSAPPSTRTPYSSGNTTPAAQGSQQPVRPGHQTAASFTPGMRQREMRENPDFIRIAVMEMAMRRRGKLDNQKPGRARWALPPRRPSARPYDIGSNGVPARWVPVSY